MPAAFQAAADAATEAGDTKERAAIMRIARNLSKNWPDNAELRERAAQAVDVIKVLVSSVSGRAVCVNAHDTGWVMIMGLY